jgi:hypothetical protein
MRWAITASAITSSRGYVALKSVRVMSLVLYEFKLSS